MASVSKLRGQTVRRATVLLLTGWLSALALAPMHAAERAADPKRLTPPKRVTIPKLDASITVDGDLNEPVWQKAAVLTPFLRNDGSGPERESTEVRLWYDADALYLGWVCRDAEIQATFTFRDSKFWEEEVVEFFVTPQGLNRYFELQWNPLGGVFDAIIRNDIDERGVSKNIEGDWGYTAMGMKSAVVVKGTVGNSSDRDQFWQAEVRIPFADLGQGIPQAGEAWRGNFYRFNREQGQPAEQLSWSPTLYPSFHEPSRFGTLVFGAGP